MNVLSRNLRIFHVWGIWQLLYCSSGWKKILYGAYMTFVICLVFTFALSNAIASSNFDLANNDLYLSLTLIGICYKMCNILYKREEIIKIMNMLDGPSFRAQGIEEMEIKKHFDRRIKTITLSFNMLVVATLSSIIINSLLVNIPQRSLPFNAWLPFDHTADLGFWIAYSHQIYAVTTIPIISVTYDTYFAGLMILICSRLNMLKSRLRSIPKVIGTERSHLSDEITEREEIRKCVRFHQEIFTCIERTNDVFGHVIFAQFCVSTFSICVSTYKLTRISDFNGEFIYLALYLACILVQILIYCWYGNEVILESTDVATVIYDMDWHPFKRSTKNYLRLIMMRSQVPRKFKGGHVVLSLNSYNNLMKLSYSMYNVLQGASS